MPISSLPPAPQTSDPSATFIAKADAFVASLSTLVTEMNAAIAAVNMTKWISGTTYAIGDVTWSPATFYAYRRKTAGAGTTDPSADATNWIGIISAAAGNNSDINSMTALTAPTVAANPMRATDLQAQTVTAFTTGGTSTAFTLTPTPAITALVTNQLFHVTFNAAAGATPTLAISGLTAKSLKYRDLTGTKQAITSAQVPSGWVSDVEYDGTDYVVLDISGSSGLSGNGIGSYTATSTLTASDLGRPASYNSASAGTLTLPTPTRIGDIIDMYCAGAGACTLARAGTATIYALGQSAVTSIVLNQGDSVMLVWSGTNWIQAAGNKGTPNSEVRLNTVNGYGSTNTMIRRFTNTTINTGTDITYADSATLGATFTINTAGVYAISYSDSFAASADMGLSLNSTQLTTAISSITAADCLALAQSATSATEISVSCTLHLAVNDVIRAHTSAGGVGTASSGHFTIARVS
jgi:hypothetical protein